MSVACYFSMFIVFDTTKIGISIGKLTGAASGLRRTGCEWTRTDARTAARADWRPDRHELALGRAGELIRTTSDAPDGTNTADGESELNQDWILEEA